MGEPVLLRNAVDGYVAEQFPNRNRPRSRKLWVKSAGGNQRFAYVFFARPFPLGVTIQHAYLRLYNGSALEGSATLTVNRVQEKWSQNRLTWANQPAVNAFTRSVTKASAPANTEWELDVTTIMQDVANGGNWFGFRFTVNDGVDEWFHSSESKVDFRPELEIQWSDAPDAPDNLSPDGDRAVGLAKPVLTWDFVDVSGDTDLQAVQVQINGTDSFSAPAFDSGVVAASEPELDLAATAYAGVPAGGRVYWRARSQDGAGLWSEWSDSAVFRFVAKTPVVLTNPAPAVAPADAFVSESTPPITWTFAGDQRHYQIIIAPANDLGRYLWNTGKITNSVTRTVTVPDKVLRKDGQKYHVRIRVWGVGDREATPGDPVYSYAEREFVFDYDPTVNSVTGLTGEPQSPFPSMKLTWSRATMPDRFEIWRDGEVIAVEDAPELFTSGTSYTYTDRLAPGRVDHDWQVVPVVNGKAAKNNPVFTGRTRMQAPWLMEVDGDNAVCLFDPAGEPSRNIVQEVQRPVGNAPPVLISQNIGGYEGTMTGTLLNDMVPGLTAREQRNRYKRLIREEGRTLLLFWLDEAFECTIYNARYKPIARADGTTEYEVSFDFFQTDFV